MLVSSHYFHLNIYLPMPRKKTTKAVASNQKFKPDTLHKRLKTMSQEELVTLVMQLAKDHPAVQEQFEHEHLAAAASKSGKMDQLVKKAIEMIDKGIDYGSYGYGRYHDGPSLDLRSVAEFVKQFQIFDDPMPGLDQIARHLIKKGKRYLEETGDEDDYDFHIVFEAIASALLKSKSEPAKIILWSYEMDDLEDYDLLGGMGTTICDHAWPVKVWSTVADDLLATLKKKPLQSRDHTRLRKLVTVLDKAKRSNEATDLLRKEAPGINEHEMLIDRLIEGNCLDEAKTIATGLLQKDSTAPQNHYRDLMWMRHLKTIAEKQKDKATLASLQAAIFLHQPHWETIHPLLKSAKTLKVEPAIRKEMEAFLLTGTLPECVATTLSGKTPIPSAKAIWPLPVFFYQPKPDLSKSKYDVLCQWAIKEKRAHDVIRWYDELKSNNSLQRRINSLEVAEAVIASYPDRAFQIYRKAAEEEMNTTSTSRYPTAVSHLRKAKEALQIAKRDQEWAKVMEEIRSKHGRKPSLMKQIAEMEAGSIVNQRRRNPKL
jgi:hypothetical protein